MNRTDRLQAIITQLQSKKIVKAQEISDRFGISLRTVYRDIRALEEAGIPIGAEAGIGYFLEESYHLPPVMFTNTEASALLLAGKLMPYLADKKVNEDYQDALIKVRSVLSNTDKEKLEKIENGLNVLRYSPSFQQPDSIFIHDIQDALVKQQVVEIHYFSKYKQENSVRKVEPISLLYYGLNWHLIAWCKLRKEFRDFRMDRIKAVNPTELRYERNLEKDFKNYLKTVEDSMQFHKIKLKVDESTLMNMSESKYWYGFTEEEKDKSEIILNFLNPDIHGFANWVLNYGAGVDIIEPKELKELVSEKVKKLCHKYML